MRTASLPRKLCHIAVLCSLITAAGCGQTKEPLSNADSRAVSANWIQRVTEQGPVRLTIRISPPEPRLSDLIEMEIEVRTPAGFDVKAPVFGTAVGDFLVHDYSDRSPKMSSDQETHTRTFRYQLEPTRSGTHLVRSIAVGFTDNREGSEEKGTAAFIESDPIEVKVTTEIEEGIPDLANLEPMLPPQPLEQPRSYWWLGVLAVIMATSALLIRRRRHRDTLRMEPRKTAEEIAHEALARLLAEQLPDKGLMTEFFVRLTGIVRGYIEATTGLKAPEQTTEEFLREMRSKAVFPPDRSARLQEFLEAADMVKYAGQRPGKEQVDLSILRAKEFVAWEVTPETRI